ncbi:M12 family metallo-peptidase [Marinicella meishanensis]|uniref:M12 family metallo-peptidase n=1 Tax=Marinicella meishanensis TaxID=2873263 RepID=UPI001CBB4808|nr:M12 family metallo-peptidase [Marinicella sp. NBU2979]
MKKISTFCLLVCSHVALAKNLFIQTEQLNHQQLPETERSAMLAQVNEAMLAEGSKQFDLQLPNGMQVTAVTDRVKHHGKNRFSWFGHLLGQPEEQLFISVVSGHYAGSLYTKSGTFEFSSADQQVMRIAELETTAFPDCDGEEPAAWSQAKQQGVPTVKSGGTIEFDVMVLYTPQARAGAGGTLAIEATAQAAVDAMNLSFSNSNVDAEGTMTHTQILGYNDTGNSSTDLSWLQGDSYVDELRTAYGADMVAMLVESMGGCGRGYVMRTPGAGFADFAVQVTRRSCAVGNLSFAHEFGHNMGLEHNPEDSSATSATASYPWSFGHYHNGEYRTVMSYSAQCASGCTRRQYFSNPNVQFNGLDTGVANTRDNARSLDLTASIVSAFQVPANDTIFEDSVE